jgi:ABC-type glutathione transport system ATPase component
MAEPTLPMLVTEKLTRTFGGGRRWYGARKPTVRAVDEVSFALEGGRTLGIVGESGSGKSTVARMLVGLLAPSSGSIRIDGREIAGASGRGRRQLRRTVQLVFQDPMGSLNPRRRVRQIIEGPLEALGGLARAQRRLRVAELMDLVGLRAEFGERYPHEFSGGQCQRIAIARALAAEPRLLVLDEPVSALDVSVQAQVLKLLKELQQRFGLTYVFISHDLAVVEAMADEIIVMRQGKVVETAPREQLFRAPEHAYTRELLAAVPALRATTA